MESPPPRPTTNAGWQAQASGRPHVKPPGAVGTRAEAWPTREATDDGDDFSHLDSSPAGPPSDEVEIVADSPAALRLAGYEGEAAPTTPASGKVAEPPSLIPGEETPISKPPRVRFRGSSNGGSDAATDARAAELQVRLSQAVVQPPGKWNLAPLREETAAHLAKEQTPEAREELRDILDRIATFETIQTRYAAAANRPAVTSPAPTANIAAITPVPSVAPAPTSTQPTGDSSEVLARVQADLGRGGPASNATAATTPTLGGTALEPLYDAVGTLKPVVSRRQNAPRYALVDDHGDVVTFVTATPDVNLQPFVGKRIGVRGSRGFMPEYRRAHVMASRITPLEEKLVR
jgi:hypothetical protein